MENELKRHCVTLSLVFLFSAAYGLAEGLESCMQFLSFLYQNMPNMSAT